MDFIEKIDMSYSYKPVLLKAMIEEADGKGRVKVDDIVDYFIDFYEERKSKGLEAEKKKSIYNDEVLDRNKVKRNIFSYPSKRFEDMKFMEKCGDIECVQFNRKIWSRLTVEEKAWIDKQCDEGLKRYYGEK